jgi:hypothetical protein
MKTVISVKFLFIFLFISMGLFFTSSMADESRWMYIGKDADSNDYYYDTKSIVKQGEDIHRVWEKRDFAKIEGIALSYKASIRLREIDCGKKEARDLYEDLILDNGKVFEYDRNQKPWKFIAPDTVQEKLYNIVCKKG